MASSPTAAADLPEYAKPPITEVVLGVQFGALTKWHAGHYGVFWNSISSEYPNFRVMPQLPAAVERFGAEAWRSQPSIQVLLNSDDMRCWLLSANESRILQLQRDRFIVNWKQVGEEHYPRYEKTIRPMFEAEWSRLRAFADRYEIESPAVTQCEMTYVNDIALNAPWKTVEDLSTVLSPWAGRGTDAFLPFPESTQINNTYLLTDQQARLHVSIQHVRRGADDRDILQLQLTVRGKPKAGGMAELLDWFDTSRRWIVRGFTDLTSQTMHNMWERTR